MNYFISLLKDLILRFGAAKICDPMEGSGTSRDVVEGLNKYKKKGISYWGGDLRNGFDLTKQQLPGKYDFCWIHPRRIGILSGTVTIPMT